MMNSSMPMIPVAFAALVLAGSVGCSTGSPPQPVRVETERGGIQILRFAPPGAVRHRMILAHGFLRHPGTMVEMAEALQRQGVETVCPQLRHSRILDARAAENALDIVALRKTLGWERAVYGGFSAGALAALLAAAADPGGCSALWLLDPVDKDGAGLRAAPAVRVPAWALFAKPGRCNARGNGEAMVAAIPDHQVEQLPGASHCDFETNPPKACYFLCGKKRDAQRIRTVHHHAAAGARSLLARGVSP